MTNFKVAMILTAALAMTGCRAAARSTVAAFQEKATLTQSTFREPQLVAPPRSEAVTVRAVEKSRVKKVPFLRTSEVREIVVREGTCEVSIDLRQGNVTIAAEPKTAFEKVSS